MRLKGDAIQHYVYSMLKFLCWQSRPAPTTWNGCFPRGSRLRRLRGDAFASQLPTRTARHPSPIQSSMQEFLEFSVKAYKMRRLRGQDSLHMPTRDSMSNAACLTGSSQVLGSRSEGTRQRCSMSEPKSRKGFSSKKWYVQEVVYECFLKSSAFP